MIPVDGALTACLQAAWLVCTVYLENRECREASEGQIREI